MDQGLVVQGYEAMSVEEESAHAMTLQACTATRTFSKTLRFWEDGQDLEGTADSETRTRVDREVRDVLVSQTIFDRYSPAIRR